MADYETGQNHIWIAFKSGDETAFSRIFFDHYSQLYHYGLKILPDEELVKDVIQDFFLYLLESRASLANEVSNVKAYLLASFRRRLLREIKRSRTEKSHLAADDVEEGLLFVIGQEDIIIGEERSAQNKKIIIRLLEELPPRQREIIYLKYYLDLSLPEISETLGISYQVAANHLYRALKTLQNSDKTRKFAGRIWLFFCW